MTKRRCFGWSHGVMVCLATKQDSVFSRKFLCSYCFLFMLLHRHCWLYFTWKLIYFGFPAKSSFPIFRLYHFIIMICGKYCLTHHDTMITMLRWSFGLMPKLNMSFWKQSKLLLRSFHAHDPDISSRMLHWCISLVIIYAYVSETLTTFSNFHQSLFWKGSVTPLYPRQSCSANESWFKHSCDWQNSNFIVGRSFSML